MRKQRSGADLQGPVLRWSVKQGLTMETDDIDLAGAELCARKQSGNCCGVCVGYCALKIGYCLGQQAVEA